MASQHPSELPPAYSEHSSYPAHATGQAIPGCQALPSGVDIREHQTPLNNPQQLFHQGVPGGLVVTGVSVLPNMSNPKNSVSFLFVVCI